MWIIFICVKLYTSNTLIQNGGYHLSINDKKQNDRKTRKNTMKFKMSMHSRIESTFSKKKNIFDKNIFSFILLGLLGKIIMTYII